MCDASNFGIGAALLQSHNGTNKMNLISAKSRLFTQAELRLSTLMRECTAIIYTLTEYEFLILGSKHPTVLFTDHKPVIFLFTQKPNPNHRVYGFQLILMKFPNLHIVWAAGKNFAIPDTLSRNTPPELLKTTHWIKNDTQLKKIKQQLHKKDPFPLIEKGNLTDKINLSGPPTNDSKYTVNQVFDLHDPLDTIPLSKLEVENIFYHQKKKLHYNYYKNARILTLSLDNSNHGTNFKQNQQNLIPQY